MIALDTNIVVRFLVNDDEAQAAKARALISANRTLLLTTVLLETEWVLRATFGLSRERIHNLFVGLCGIEGVSLQHERVVTSALEGFAAGLDFADALHLASSAEAQSFATFDSDLVRKAKTVRGFVPVVAP